MAGTALRRRLTWRLATVVANTAASATARRLSLELDGWDGHVPGQHLDVRLTAEDGYQAQRSYSIASAPESATVDLIVQPVPDGEVSLYLSEELQAGEQLELRGPIGGHFVWHTDLGGPLQLIAGGSGVAPFLAMLDHHAAASSDVPARLLYSARTADDIIASKLLDTHAERGVGITITLTRDRGAGTLRRGRVTAQVLRDLAWQPSERPQVFVCGPTRFVEAVADELVALGHPPSAIKTERFG